MVLQNVLLFLKQLSCVTDAKTIQASNTNIAQKKHIYCIIQLLRCIEGNEKDGFFVQIAATNYMKMLGFVLAVVLP